MPASSQASLFGARIDLKKNQKINKKKGCDPAKPSSSSPRADEKAAAVLLCARLTTGAGGLKTGGVTTGRRGVGGTTTGAAGRVLGTVLDAGRGATNLLT
jgi:hypothetical protein